MKMFRKKQAVDKPRVIAASEINAVACAYCRSIYRPEYRHLEFRQGWVGTSAHSKCPMCDQLNPVTFKEPLEKESPDEKSSNT